MSKRKDVPDTDAEPPAKREKLDKAVDLTDEKKEEFSYNEAMCSLTTINFADPSVEKAYSDIVFITKDGARLHFFTCALGDPKHSSRYLRDVAEKAKAEGKAAPILLEHETAEEMNFILNWTLKSEREKWVKQALPGKHWDTQISFARVASKYDYPELVKIVVDALLSYFLPWPVVDLVELLRSLKQPDPEEIVASKWLLRNRRNALWNERDLIHEGKTPSGDATFWKACAVVALDKKACNCAAATWMLAPFITEVNFVHGLAVRILHEPESMGYTEKNAWLKEMHGVCNALPKDRGCVVDLFQQITLGHLATSSGSEKIRFGCF